MLATDEKTAEFTRGMAVRLKRHATLQLAGRFLFGGGPARYEAGAEFTVKAVAFALPVKGSGYGELTLLAYDGRTVSGRSDDFDRITGGEALS